MKLNKFGIAGILLTLLIFSSYTIYNDADKNQILLRLVLQGLSSHHYQPQSIDDQFSQEIIDLYFDRLDYGKRFFVQSDIDKLSKYSTQVDEQIEKGSYEFFEQATTTFLNRVEESKAFYEDILSKPFDMGKYEEYDTDPKNQSFANNKSELKEKWRKLLKYQTLSRLTSYLENQKKLKERLESGELSKEDLSESDQELLAMSFDQFEEKARNRTKKVYDDRFHTRSKNTLTDYRNIYIRTVANRFDPHTDYFPPKDKENFDIRISGQFQGIGARLVDREGMITVSQIIPGSPSAKQGELEVGDIILKVGQSIEEPVDVVDMRIDDAVLLIRGKKGTEVKLTVRKSDGLETVIPIVRDIVNLEDTYAQSLILKEDEDKKRIGYIQLPSFYANFQDPNGRSCSEDIEKELNKLKAENVDGIILDLRDNPGGSLRDVIDMTGLFIENGPIVQVKSRNRQAQVYSDRNPSITYDGPLVVMVNSISASASEILAAAIQDYDRGVVIGTRSTFGKGTVQQIVNLDEYIRGGADLKPLGAMRLTTQKFYRINGDATQQKGVIPDIIVPGNYSYLELGEKYEDYSMPWDRIEEVDFKEWNPLYDEAAVIAKSQKRIENNQIFDIIEENARRLEMQQNDDIYPLQLEAFVNKREELTKQADKFKDIETEIEGFHASTLTTDKDFINADSLRLKSRQKWIKVLEKDPYVFESLQVIQDMIGNSITKN